MSTIVNEENDKDWTWRSTNVINWQTTGHEFTIKWSREWTVTTNMLI